MITSEKSDAVVLVTWICWIAELFNDFYEYDPSSYTWTNLTDLSQFTSVIPPARKSHGFSSSETKLYVFGGLTSKSGELALEYVSVPSLTECKQERYQMIFILGIRPLLPGPIFPILYQMKGHLHDSVMDLQQSVMSSLSSVVTMAHRHSTIFMLIM